MYSNHKEPFLLLSIIFFTVLLSPLALAETIKGQFNCRIKYQEILEMNKGEPSIFSNYENGLKLEDEIKFF